MGHHQAIRNSLKASLGGWLVAAISVSGALYFDPYRSDTFPVAASTISMVIAMFVFGAWWVAVLPIHLLADPESRIWRGPISTTVGAAAGLAAYLLWLWQWAPVATPIVSWLLFPCVTTGGVIGFLSAHYHHARLMASASPPSAGFS